MINKNTLALLCLLALLHGSMGWRADYGYVEVRPGAHMFWLLEPCTGCLGQSIFQEPLIIWMQGGPGASSTGYGNFMEVGPYGIGWERRKHTWTERSNILFIDNPVGTGFSYVEDGTNLTTTNDEVVADLMTLFTEWLYSHVEFQHAPVYMFCESYGGKMGAQFALEIHRAQQRGELHLTFRGVALGDSWIAPVDFTQAWLPYLEALSLLDGQPLKDLQRLADSAKMAVANGKLEEATELWGALEEGIGNATDNVDWYNVLRHNVGDDTSSAAGSPAVLKAGLQGARRRLLGRYHPESLRHFMNHEVKHQLKAVVPHSVQWGSQADAVFAALAGDFMVDVVHVVDELLAAGVPVTIYQGQLDLICCTLGVDMWLQRLKWPGLQAFQAAPRKAFYRENEDEPANTAGFVRRHKHLAMYYILEAGHMIPADQPSVALQMLTMMMGDDVTVQAFDTAVAGSATGTVDAAVTES